VRKAKISANYAEQRISFTPVAYETVAAEFGVVAGAAGKPPRREVPVQPAVEVAGDLFYNNFIEFFPARPLARGGT
jgi:hypothetical protein